ncbi:MAG: TIGR02996 domain-containing protein, partial [Archangium sp.]
MTREDEFLQRIAEQPDSKELRLVFADWLQEHGDPRGEVIALFERGELLLSERRRIARATALHSHNWLGPLSGVADLHRTRFIGGFVVELVCHGGRPADAWSRLIDEPRLATVRSFGLPPRQSPASLEPLLASKVWRSLDRLELGSDDWAALRSLPTLNVKKAVVSSWGVFRRELAVLGDVPAFQRAPVLGLASTEFIQPLVVPEIVLHVREQHSALGHFEEVQLLCRYGAMEGAASWLLSADEATVELLPGVRRWTVAMSEVSFTRVRDEDAFSSLEIDLSLPESSTGEKEVLDVQSAFERRLALAASVLVQLAPARLRHVRVLLAPGARLRPKE